MRTALDFILFVTQSAEVLDVMSGLHVACGTRGDLLRGFGRET